MAVLNPANVYNAILDASPTIAVSKTIPKNTYFESLNGSKFIKSATGAITFQGVGIVGDPRHQIFSGFANGEVTFTGATPTRRPEWWGAKGDGVTDDLAAFVQMEASIPAGGATQNSGHIVLTSGHTYYLSDSFNINNAVFIEGHGGDHWANRATLKFPVNKVGIIIHHSNTATGVNVGNNALWTKLHNFALDGSAAASSTSLPSATTHTVTINGLNVLRTAGPNFGVDGSNWSGNTITVNGYVYQILTVVDANNITLIKPRVLARGNYGSTYVSKEDNGTYAQWRQEWVGQIININGQALTIASVAADGSYLITTTPYLGPVDHRPFATQFNATAGGVDVATDIITATSASSFDTGWQVVFAAGTAGLPAPLVATSDVSPTYYYYIRLTDTTFKLATTYANATNATPIAIDLTTVGDGAVKTLQSTAWTGTSELQGIANTAGVAARPNIFHGIDQRATAEIKGMKIWNFTGDGINADSSKVPGTAFATPNNNVSRYARNSFYYNHGNGIHQKGTNSNQSLIENNDASNNRGAGYYDNSFLGNNYLSNHTSFNSFAGSFFTGAVNYSTLLGEYHESGQPSSYFSQGVTVIGGNYGSGIDPLSQHASFNNSFGRGALSSLYVPDTLSAKFGAFMARGDHSIFGFGAAEEPSNLGSGGDVNNVKVFQYQVSYGGDVAVPVGWYNLFAGGAYVNQSKTVLAFSGELAADGNGKLAFPSGFRTAYTDPTISRVIKGTITIDPASIAATT
ncbi:MAG: right-handed parallel beta-helix repeat-containing protein, partial [Blastocatellia bacterium]|nr:right-handed parallel beta-helix repeat-containing protein [Blastocatellia bacterium]